MDPTSDFSNAEPSTTSPTTHTSPGSWYQQRQEASGEYSGSKIDSRTALRQGFLAPLRPLPLANGPAAPNTEETINWPRAREIILDILKKHIDNDFSMSLVNRLLPSLVKAPVSENQNLTCLIITQRDAHSNSWHIALKELEEQFNVGSISGFTIEFMDPEMFRPLRPHILEEEAPIEPFWDELCPKIGEELSELRFFSISCYRLGRHPEGPKNPVTISIGAPLDSCETWDSLTDTIRQVVKRIFPGEIEISIVPMDHPFGDERPFIYWPEESMFEVHLPISAFESAVKMGSSFGPKDVDTSATMGGTVRLRDPQGKSQDAFMSVFHCFRTVVGREIESHGLRPGSHSQFQSVSPSHLDSKTKLRWLNEKIRKMNESERRVREELESTGHSRRQEIIDSRTSDMEQYQAEVNTIEKFDSRAGCLWACSGFQREHLNDWSLSLAMNRSSIPNTLPPRLAIGRHVSGCRYSSFDDEINSHSTENLKPGNLVWE